MKRIHEAATECVPIVWTGKWEYVLRSGEGVLGVLQIEKEPSMDAVAHSTDGQWQFRKKWFPYEKVTLRPIDSDFEVAVFKNKRTGKRAVLEFPYGKVFYWMPTSFWLNKYLFTNIYGDPLIHFRRDSNPLTALVVPKGHSTGLVEIGVSAFSLPELPLLTLLGWYLMIIDAI